MSKENALETKRPNYIVIRDFKCEQTKPFVDYALVFSVLNSCKDKEIEKFFNRIALVMLDGGMIYISRAYWFKDSFQIPGATQSDKS